MQIRRATLADTLTISKIHALSWKAAYEGIVSQDYLDNLKDDFWVEFFENSIWNDVLTVQLVLENDLPVGCISYGKSRDTKLPDWGEIVSLYLLPQYWGKGYAKRLLDAALTDFHENSYQNVFLWALIENERARKFYEKNKFTCNNEECIFEIAGEKLVDLRYVFTF